MKFIESCPVEKYPCREPFSETQWTEFACQVGDCPAGYACCSDSCFKFKICKQSREEIYTTDTAVTLEQKPNQSVTTAKLSYDETNGPVTTETPKITSVLIRTVTPDKDDTKTITSSSNIFTRTQSLFVSQDYEDSETDDETVSNTDTSDVITSYHLSSTTHNSYQVFKEETKTTDVSLADSLNNYHGRGIDTEDDEKDYAETTTSIKNNFTQTSDSVKTEAETEISNITTSYPSSSDTSYDVFNEKTKATTVSIVDFSNNYDSSGIDTENTDGYHGEAIISSGNNFTQTPNSDTTDDGNSPVDNMSLDLATEIFNITTRYPSSGNSTCANNEVSKGETKTSAASTTYCSNNYNGNGSNTEDSDQDYVEGTTSSRNNLTQTPNSDTSENGNGTDDEDISFDLETKIFNLTTIDPSSGSTYASNEVSEGDSKTVIVSTVDSSNNYDGSGSDTEDDDEDYGEVTTSSRNNLTQPTNSNTTENVTNLVDKDISFELEIKIFNITTVYPPSANSTYVSNGVSEGEPKTVSLSTVDSSNNYDGSGSDTEDSDEGYVEATTSSRNNLTPNSDTPENGNDTGDEDISFDLETEIFNLTTIDPSSGNSTYASNEVSEGDSKTVIVSTVDSSNNYDGSGSDTEDDDEDYGEVTTSSRNNLTQTPNSNTTENVTNLVDKDISFELEIKIFNITTIYPPSANSTYVSNGVSEGEPKTVIVSTVDSSNNYDGSGSDTEDSDEGYAEATTSSRNNLTPNSDTPENGNDTGDEDISFDLETKIFNLTTIDPSSGNSTYASNTISEGESKTVIVSTVDSSNNYDGSGSDTEDDDEDYGEVTTSSRTKITQLPNSNTTENVTSLVDRDTSFELKTEIFNITTKYPSLGNNTYVNKEVSTGETKTTAISTVGSSDIYYDASGGDREEDDDNHTKTPFLPQYNKGRAIDDDDVTKSRKEVLNVTTIYPLSSIAVYTSNESEGNTKMSGMSNVSDTSKSINNSPVITNTNVDDEDNDNDDDSGYTDPSGDEDTIDIQQLNNM
ncbi:hypothetical protein Zmor_023646 [Zophobas morio]|uniref:Uncharacterized protein n=1 Tax=Zophobas morio TaxID=2755281 RepID=A0AA38HYG0_9CUCU|nr:hypothetical protein Zmor_023646 [Zophobas morio]